MLKLKIWILNSTHIHIYSFFLFFDIFSILTTVKNKNKNLKFCTEVP